MARRREIRRPRIVERRLIGEMTCRNGGCARDGAVRVEQPCVQYSGRNYSEVEVWVSRWYCEQCAAKEVAGTRLRGGR